MLIANYLKVCKVVAVLVEGPEGLSAYPDGQESDPSLGRQTPQGAPEFILGPFLPLVVFHIACSSFASPSGSFLRLNLEITNYFLAAPFASFSGSFSRLNLEITAYFLRDLLVPRR